MPDEPIIRTKISQTEAGNINLNYRGMDKIIERSKFIDDFQLLAYIF